MADSLTPQRPVTVEDWQALEIDPNTRIRQVDELLKREPKAAARSARDLAELTFAPRPELRARWSSRDRNLPAKEWLSLQFEIEKALWEELEDAHDARTRIERIDDFVAENATAFRYLREEASREPQTPKDQRGSLPRAAPFVVPDAPTDLPSRIRSVDRELATPNPESQP